MTTFFSALAFTLIVIALIYRPANRTGPAKRFALYAPVLFILIVISASVAGCTLVNESTDENTSTSSSSQPESLSSKEPFPGPPGEKSNNADNAPGREQLENNATGNGTLKVYFIDVGQAEAILIQLPSGQNMLIDAGNNSDGNLVIDYLKHNGVTMLDHVIGTHPHEDHIGGLDAVIDTFEIGNVYLPKVSHTTKTYEALLLAVKNKALRVTGAYGGIKLDIGPEATAQFIAPNDSDYDNLNNYSAVLKLTYHQTSFIFTGDAEAASENQMLGAGYNLTADVLKVGHHGSASSTSADFLKAVAPQYAVISVGKDNDYGHPHAETLSAMASFGVPVFRTDLQGTILAASDGEKVTFNTKPISVVERAFGVEIANIDLKAELVTIKNNSDAMVNISGWELVSEKGANQVFTFPSGTTLAPGTMIKVISGPDAAPEPDAVVWTTQNIWNNDGDPGALYDSGGNLISKYPR